MLDLKKLKYRDPILLSSTDGVGTKLKIALDCNNLSFLGIDLVAMCVNDILANGGEPLFFLDYFSSSKIKDKFFLEIIKSINKGCKMAGCSLIGGETAEMPGMYRKNDFDIAGFAVGVVERKNLINKNNVKTNAKIIGLMSNGFHSNGFSLIRKVLQYKKIPLGVKIQDLSSKSIGNLLISPTKIYVNEILPLIKKNYIASIAHITGGGIFENIERAIPKNLMAIIETKGFKIPKLFSWFREQSKISINEMLNTFNCGIGMVLIINKSNEEFVLKYLNKNKIKFSNIGYIGVKKDHSKSVLIKKFGEWNLR